MSAFAAVGNSRDSHRLIHLAKKHGDDAELKVVDGLFAAYFENEKDNTDHDVLKGVAVGAGIPEAEFKKAIVESDEGGEEDAMEFVNIFERVKAQDTA
ncbi:hypothetical protein V8C34DRAFT_305271 [Trichoderma compactum]